MATGGSAVAADTDTSVLVHVHFQRLSLITFEKTFYFWNFPQLIMAFYFNPGRFLFYETVNSSWISKDDEVIPVQVGGALVKTMKKRRHVY